MADYKLVFVLQKLLSLLALLTSLAIFVVVLGRDARYCIFADIRYVDIFQLILADN